MGESVLFTIGFAKKSAREFFTRLRDPGVRTVIDIRLNNVSQLAGFTKRPDLEFFLERILGIGLVYLPQLAPTKQILDAYKKKQISWPEYESQFNALMAARHIETEVTPELLHMGCLLCSEPKPDRCHRRLVAEYLRGKWGNISIVHL
jgi:uncharacterized protein (DUF488 family)